MNCQHWLSCSHEGNIENLKNLKIATLFKVHEAFSVKKNINANCVANKRIKVFFEVCHFTSTFPRYERNYKFYKTICSLGPSTARQFIMKQQHCNKTKKAEKNKKVETDRR